MELLKSRYELGAAVSEDMLSFSYLAQDRRTQTPVFITQYKPEFINSNTVPRLLRMAEKLLSLRHPNLLVLLDYDYDGASFYSIHEFRENIISLDALLNESPDWDIKAIGDVVHQVVSAFSYVESNDLLFGNLGLTHIYLNRRREVMLANVLLPALIVKDNFEKFTILEEAQFYAPEFLKWQTLSPQTDVYGIGILLYFLYTGGWPYKMNSDILLLKKSLLKTPLAPKALNPKIPDHVSRLIETCISKDPKDRFDSVSAVSQMLTGVMDVKPSGICPKPGQEITDMQKELEDDIWQARAGRMSRLSKNIVMVVLPIMFLDHFS